MRVIGLTGPAGCGKTTIAKQLVVEYGAVPLSFADFFKVPAIVLDGMPFNEVYGGDPKSELTRRYLQQRGTELGRDVHGQNVWVDHMVATLVKLGIYGVTRVVIDDVRFDNEALMVSLLPLGRVWYVGGRGGLQGEAAEHRSERGISASYLDQVIMNDADHSSLEQRVNSAAHHAGWTLEDDTDD